MRLGVDIRELERGKSTGIGTFLRQFIEYARRARPDGTLLLYGNQHTETEGLAGGNVEVHIHPEGRTLWWDQVVLVRLLRRHRPQVFFSPYAKGPLRAPCPLAVTVHDLTELAYPPYAAAMSPWRRWAYRSLVRASAGRAGLVFTDSRHAAGDIGRLLGLADGRVRVLPLGVGEGLQPVEDRDRLQRALQRYGIEGPYLLYVGNFRPHKNIDGLLQAYALLPDRLRRYALVLAGRRDGWTEAAVATASRLGLEGRVRFVGGIDQEDLGCLYTGATLFVFPSLYEGFGLPPLEAMACGTAVVASERTALPEVVGDAGVLVDTGQPEAFAQAMAALLEDEGRRAELERKGLQRAGTMRAGNVAAAQLSALEELAGSAAVR